MTKTRKMWVYRPPKPAKPKVSESVKVNVAQKANELVETVLKPRHIKPPPKSVHINYIVDIYTRWYRHYFYFCAKYAVPGPNALAPFFEHKFARLEYTGDRDHFNLSFMRYTGEWVEIYPHLSLGKCLIAIKDEEFFHP